MATRPTPRPTLTRLLTHAVLTTLVITTGGALLVMGSAGMADSPERDAAVHGTQVSEPVRTPDSKLMKRYDCSTTGFGADPTAEPQAALVRSPRGKVRVVTFAEGWAVHNSGRNAGRNAALVAVCLRPLP